MKLVVFLASLCLAFGQECKLPDGEAIIDCLPEKAAKDINQAICQSRKCCWRTDSSVPDNVPRCYYPSDYSGYTIVSQKSSNAGAQAHLKRDTPSAIDADIPELLVEIIPQTEKIVRVRITDPKNKRWEPPLPAIASPKIVSKLLYTFKIDEGTRRLEVTRAMDGQPNAKILSFDLATLVFTNEFIQINGKLPSDVLYGLGERKGRLRHSLNYTVATNFNQDHPPEVGVRSYGTHPFYLSVESGGTTNGVWFFNSNGMDMVLTPAPSITYRTIGGVLDFFAFVGPTPADVVHQYLSLVGHPKMVPYWALGFHLCRWGYESLENTRAILKKNLDAGVRVDTQWNDIDYMDHHNDFTFDPVNFKGLREFVNDLHDAGRHYVVIIDPAVSGGETPGTYPPYDKGLEYNIFMKDLKGNHFCGKVWNDKCSIFPDFTHPNASRYWTEMFAMFHKEIPFDGAWIDMNEPATIITGHLPGGCPLDKELVYVPSKESLQTKTLCLSDQHYWSSHYNVHNMYGFTEAIATYNALSTIRPNKRPLIISRSSFSGQGFYSNHWTGDVYSSFTDLRDSVSDILEFSFYGLPLVGADICGFIDNTTVELCARWHALGAFYPFARNHNTEGALAQDPASLGGKVLIAANNAFYWRYKLLPHLYTQFYYAHTRGDTVTRPLFFEYPEDKETYDIDEQFLWGSGLMVVPALHENQTEINAYFPQGIWYDLQNRTDTINALEKGRYVKLAAYDDTIQFFIKGGTAVFFQEPGKTTTESRENPYGLYVFLDGNNQAKGEMFVDDGESIDSIVEKKFEIITVTASVEKIVIQETTSQKLTYMKGIYEIHVFGLKSNPKQVLVAGRDTMFDFKAQNNILVVAFPEASLHSLTIDIKY